MKNLPLSKLVVYPVCAMALAAPSAYAKVNFYGTLIPTVQSTDPLGDADSFIELSSNETFFGFKGSNGLNNGMKLFYEVDWELDVSDGGELVPRNQKIGVSGSMGEVFVGQYDTPLRQLALPVDLFDNMTGDIEVTFNGEDRPNNIIQYTSPKLQGGKLKVMAAVVLPETPDGENATSIGGTYRSGKILAGIAIDDGIEGAEVTTTRFMGRYDMGKWVVGGLYQTTDDGGDESGTAKMVSGTYKLDGKSSIRAQWVDSDIASTIGAGLTLQSQLSIAYDRKLGSKTKAFAFYATGDDGAENDPQEQSVMGVGIHHEF